MRDMALHIAGALAILIACAHGAIAEVSVFPKAQIAPRVTRRLLRFVWQASTLDWIAVGVLLFSAPWLGSEVARHYVVGAAIVIYAYAAIGNAYIARGPHLGWIGMACVIALAVVGF